MDGIDVIRSEMTIDSAHRDREIEDLKSSLNFAHGFIVELQTSQRNLIEELKTVKKDLADLKKATTSDHDRIVYLDDNSRRSSLRFRGLAEAPRETWEQCQALVLRLLRKVLGIKPEIERAHRLGPKTNPTTGERIVNREVIVKFLRFTDKDFILNNRKRFAPVNVSVREDFSSDTKELRASFYPKIQEARSKGMIAYAKYRTMVSHRPRGSRGAQGRYNSPPRHHPPPPRGAHGPPAPPRGHAQHQQGAQQHGTVQHQHASHPGTGAVPKGTHPLPPLHLPPPGHVAPLPPTHLPPPAINVTPATPQHTQPELIPPISAANSEVTPEAPATPAGTAAPAAPAAPAVPAETVVPALANSAGVSVPLGNPSESASNASSGSSASSTSEGSDAEFEGEVPADLSASQRTLRSHSKRPPPTSESSPSPTKAEESKAARKRRNKKNKKAARLLEDVLSE